MIYKAIITNHINTAEKIYVSATTKTLNKRYNHKMSFERKKYT